MMADVFEWPKELRLPLRKGCDFPELTCTICGRTDCDMTYQFYFGGEYRIVGVHANCVKILVPKQ